MQQIDAVITETAAPTEQQRLKVLVSAYACQPGKGSELGAGWNWVQQISRFSEAWVLTAAEYREPIEAHLREHPLPNPVHWVYVDIPRAIGFWKQEDRGRRIHYHLWQFWAYLKGRELHRQIGFDIVHHVTYGCYWTPSYLSQLPVPFIWGPVGGAESVPHQFYDMLDKWTIDHERLHDLVVSLSHQDPWIKRTHRRAAICLPTTDLAADNMRKLGARNVQVSMGIALPESEIEKLGQMPIREQPETFRLIGLGRLIGWKGTHLGVMAFARFNRQFPNSEYLLVGDGEEVGRLTQLANELGVGDKVRILEGRTRQEAMDIMSECDVLMYPCLHDAPGWVNAEAMAAGRPVIYLLGAPDVPGIEKTGIAVGEVPSIEAAVEGLAAAMLRLATDNALRLSMAHASREMARTVFNWQRVGENAHSLYRQYARQQTT